ncbi:hypothetical protein STENM36S_09583 [Streptomyces tendae]
MLETDRPDPFEDRLSAALCDAGDDFQADRAAFVTAGRSRGRRALLRRRTAVVGGMAGVALAGVGGALVLPADDPAAPAPAMEQLRKVALSEEWDRSRCRLPERQHPLPHGPA